MPDQEAPPLRDQCELEAVLAVYKEAYEHLRHLQNMRATYFNFYLLAAGGAIGAVAALTRPGVIGSHWPTNVVLGTLITVGGVLTTARIERWIGHIAHELVTIQRLRRSLRNGSPVLEKVLAGGARQREIGWFHRPIWSPDRTVEHLACILGSLAGVVLSLSAAPYPCPPGRLLLGSVLAAAVLGEWFAEAKHQRTKHLACCRTPPGQSTGEEDCESQSS